MATEILKTLLKDITPKKWYDSRIPDRYAEIVKLASEKISPESASVFAEPKILESAYEEKIEARWFIPDSMAGAVPVSSLLPAEQKKAVDLLNARVGKIVEFGNALLLAEKPENIRWGQLLLSACSCPSLDYVYAKDDQVVMTAWGFNFKPDANASGLVTVGTNPKPEIVYPFEPEKEIQNPPEVIEEPKKAEITDVEESPVINDISEEQATPPPVIPPKKDNPPMLDSKSIFDWWKWLKYLLWFLLLLLLILLLSRGCNGGYGFLVDPESEEKEEVVNPPGTNPPGTNPPGTNPPGYIKPVEVKLPCQDYQSRLDKLQDEINKLINDCNNRNN